MIKEKLLGFAQKRKCYVLSSNSRVHTGIQNKDRWKQVFLFHYSWNLLKHKNTVRIHLKTTATTKGRLKTTKRVAIS